MKTLLSAIVKAMPGGADTVKRPIATIAADILLALSDAGYVIVPRQCPEDVLTAVVGIDESTKGTFAQQYAKAVRLTDEANNGGQS